MAFNELEFLFMKLDRFYVVFLGPTVTVNTATWKGEAHTYTARYNIKRIYISVP